MRRTADAQTQRNQTKMAAAHTRYCTTAIERDGKGQRAALTTECKRYGAHYIIVHIIEGPSICLGWPQTGHIYIKCFHNV